MNSRITHSSYVIGFLDKNFCSDDISAVLKEEVEKLLENIPTDDLDDWEIIFNALYTNSDSILLFRKTKSYKEDKYKEIVIHIPIPLDSEIKWGVKPEQRIKTGINENILKYADKIVVDPAKFKDRTTYILACMRKAIKECFNLGFTINGKRIKA